MTLITTMQTKTGLVCVAKCDNPLCNNFTTQHDLSGSICSSYCWIVMVGYYDQESPSMDYTIKRLAESRDQLLDVESLLNFEFDINELEPQSGEFNHFAVFIKTDKITPDQTFELSSHGFIIEEVLAEYVHLCKESEIYKSEMLSK